MNIEITARNFTPSSDLKSFINDKLLYLLRFDSNIHFAKVVLLKESRAEKVELIISSKNNRYVTSVILQYLKKPYSLLIILKYKRKKFLIRKINIKMNFNKLLNKYLD